MGSPPLKIYFDHFTAGNGQKGYCTCRQVEAHGNCTRWRNIFGTKEEYASYMLAWEGYLSHADRTGQMGSEPTPEQIASVRATVVLEEF